MKERLKRAGRALVCMLGLAAVVTAAIPAVPAKADYIYPGYYSVTVVPTYQNPDTGLIDDVGQNPGIGNMMVQAQVQPVGYVEVEEDGTIWLNTRWNQADANIYAGFETSSDGSNTWIQRDFEVTNQYVAGSYEFMGNVFDATVTDYRFQLDTLNDTIRCTNYVDAMARECIWFCYITDIYEGVGDEWNIVQEPNMADYTASINQLEADEYYETPAPAVQAPSTESSTSETTPEIKDRKVADAKVNETSDSGKKKNNSSTGIVGLDSEDENKDSGLSTSSVVLILVAGILLGALVVGVIFYCINRKKKKQSNLFDDVDDSPSEETSSEDKEK